ncbi:pyruvate carboxyltransferase [Saccharomonospora piscinae]|uniref:LeuA family protein n=1 Tax=Saccharomonospora piscinae TaxID=687388 RepID=UPI001106E220|nr:pyruvate carboxyltransferase [Saccharomonospora piscinae]TLW90601.1 pyruvate carboxyltransferase [Saccharomonospora piscinae]
MAATETSGLRRISIFDTTLRDGEQAPGNGMRPEQKLRLGALVDGLGVDIVETGFPASSASDFEATRSLSKQLTNARFATFVRAVRDDVEAAVRAGGVDNHQIQVLATGSDIHLEHKRGISRADGEREMADTITFARGLGITDISVAIEDATRGTDDLLHGLVDTVLEAGATTIAVGDTCGCLLPGEFGELIAKIREWAPRPVVVATHCHDDLGLAVANSLAGVTAGADEVQATLGGIGERAGNASLEEIVAALVYKGASLGVRTTVKPERLFPAYQVLAETIGLPPLRNKAVVGVNAFATQAGIHQAGILRRPETYEYLEPEVFGRRRQLMVGRHSGRAIIRYLLDRLGTPVDDEAFVDRMYAEYVLGNESGECHDLETMESLIGQHIEGRDEAAALR